MGVTKKTKCDVAAAALRVLLFVMVCVEIPQVYAWNYGDIVPVSTYLRINRTLPSSSNPIPYDFCPRFGWNKLVQIPSIDYGSSESDVAIKFEIGRGVGRQTKWMSLKEVPNAVNGLTAPKHLTMVVFKFGYQMGAVGRFTSFRALATYSERSHEVITIRYEWDEHRSYNPHLALGAVSAVAVIAFVFLVHRLSWDALTSQLKTKIVVVHEREE